MIAAFRENPICCVSTECQKAECTCIGRKKSYVFLPADDKRIAGLKRETHFTVGGTERTGKRCEYMPAASHRKLTYAAVECQDRRLGNT